MGLYQYDSTEDKLKLVAGSTNFSDAPVGAIFPFGGTDIPVSFLLCDGSAVSRTDYEDLFNVIGTAFGTGDGSTTFNLPDLREAVPKGAGETGQTVGAHVKSGGLSVGEFLDDRIQNIGKMKAQATSGYSLTSGGVAGYINANSTLRTGDTTEVKSVGVNYIIKAKQIGMPTDFASAVGDIVVDKNTYSTSETIVGKWVDGKPIYRRVFYINNPNTNWTEVTLLNPCNIDWIVKRDYTAKRTNNAVLTEYYNFDSDNFEVHLLVHDGELGYYCQSSTILSAMSITIEYTKAD